MSTLVVSSGARISGRMPTEAERRELGMHEGVPVLVVEREEGEPEIYPADRHVIEVGERPAES